MQMRSIGWRPLVFCFAAAAISITASIIGARAQSAPVAERIKQCAACHGEDGNSQMANLPSLARQPEFFIINQLFLMREGVRKVDAMAALVKDLKDDDLQALAKHYAALTPKASGEPIDPALVQRGSELAATRRCGSCHLPALTGADQIRDRQAACRLSDPGAQGVARREAPRRRHVDEPGRRRPQRCRSHGARTFCSVALTPRANAPP